MNGELANLIALALYGSRSLRSDGTSDLWTENSTFQFVAAIEFVAPPGRFGRQQAYHRAEDWFAALASAGTDRIWLVIPEAQPGPLEPHLAAGFSNGGSYALLATGERGATLWAPYWEVTARDDPRNRIWSVRLTGSAVGEASPVRPDVQATRDELVGALGAIGEFALDHDLRSWADRFEDALGRARSSEPRMPYHPDLVPPGLLSLQARQLLAAACQSWVFGGMGSWNDLWLDLDADETGRMKRVTRNLYTRMLEAFVSATNDELVIGR